MKDGFKRGSHERPVDRKIGRRDTENLPVTVLIPQQPDSVDLVIDWLPCHAARARQLLPSKRFPVERKNAMMRFLLVLRMCRSLEPSGWNLSLCKELRGRSEERQGLEKIGNDGRIGWTCQTCSHSELRFCPHCFKLRRFIGLFIARRFRN